MWTVAIFHIVIPAKAGIHHINQYSAKLYIDPRLRGDDREQLGSICPHKSKMAKVQAMWTVAIFHFVISAKAGIHHPNRSHATRTKNLTAKTQLRGQRLTLDKLRSNKSNTRATL